MAKLKGPLLSLSAHGKIANLLCFRSRSKTQSVLRAYRPKNPQTSAQLYAREIFQIGVRKAKGLTTAQKAYLDTLSNLYNNNPANNIYLSMYLTEVKNCGKYNWKKYNKIKYGSPENYTI